MALRQTWFSIYGAKHSRADGEPQPRRDIGILGETRSCRVYNSVSWGLGCEKAARVGGRDAQEPGA